MKKISSFILVIEMIFIIFFMPTFSSVFASESVIGNNVIKITKFGTKIVFSKNYFDTYFYATPVDIKDFTVKLKLNAPPGENWGYFKIILGYNGPGTVQNNIFILPKRSDAFDVEAAIVNKKDPPTISPSSIEIPYNLIKNDVVIRGKLIDAHTYSLDFNNGEYVYKYNFSKNFNLNKDISNNCYLGFGGKITADDSELNSVRGYNIIVKEIDGVVINKGDYMDISYFKTFDNKNYDNETDISSEVNDSSDNTAKTENDSDVTINKNNEKDSNITNTSIDKTNKNLKKNNEKNSFKNKNITFVIVGTLLLLSYLVMAVIILIKKKSSKSFVNKDIDE